MHFLTVWGLTQKQEKELQRKLNSRVDSSVVLMGAVSVEMDLGNDEVMITGKHDLVEHLNLALTSSAKVASNPGSKMGMSFRFDETNVETIIEAVEKPKRLSTELHLNLIFSSKSQKPYAYLTIVREGNIS